MKNNFILLFLVFLGIFLISVSVPADSQGPRIQDIKSPGFNVKPRFLQQNSKAAVRPEVNFGKIPLYFIFNKGQVKKKAKFYAKASRYTLWLTKEGFVFDSVKKVKVEAEVEKEAAPFGQVRNAFGERKISRKKTQKNTKKISTYSTQTIRDVSALVFLNANKNPEMVPVNESKLKVNYFIGNDPSKWHCDVPTSKAVLYKNLYKNIDLKVYGIEKQIEYDWIVKPGGNPGDIRVAYKNVKGTRLDEEGNLLIETDFGELIHKRPVSYQTRTAQSTGRRAYSTAVGAGLRACPLERRAVQVTFKKITKNTYGFAVGEYDKDLELIIDPVVLAYSTYLGGGEGDFCYGIAVDNNGNAYVTGSTWSTDFP